MSEQQSSAVSAEYQRCMDMLGDVPGPTLEDRLTRYIGCYMALQIKAGAQPQTVLTSDKIENMLDRIVEAAVYYEQAEGIYNRPAKTELQEAKAAVREVLARHCQAESAK